MKPICLLFLLCFLSARAQKVNVSNLSETELPFFTAESENNHMYLTDNPRILIAFNATSFSFFIDSKSYTFFTNFFSDSNYKFKIRNGNDVVVGYGQMNDSKNYDVTLYFDDNILAKKLKTNLVQFSQKNEIAVR
jgi:hypothetical protein